MQCLSREQQQSKSFIVIRRARLADVYAAIAFYLNHQQEVETYLQLRQQQAQEIRKMNEARAAGDITPLEAVFSYSPGNQELGSK